MTTTHEAGQAQTRVWRAKQRLRVARKRLKTAQREITKANVTVNREEARLRKAIEKLEALGISEDQGSFDLDERGHVKPRHPPRPEQKSNIIRFDAEKIKGGEFS